jgi:hypothetical protein
MGEMKYLSMQDMLYTLYIVLTEMGNISVKICVRFWSGLEQSWYPADDRPMTRWDLPASAQLSICWPPDDRHGAEQEFRLPVINL